MKFILSILWITCIVLVSSCYNDKESLLYGISPNSPCTDSAGIASYSLKVVPILRQNCYSCHTGGFPSGGVLLGTYTNDKATAQSGKLYGAISHSVGFSPMPKGMPKLNNCQLAVIKKWIDGGMLNN